MRIITFASFVPVHPSDQDRVTIAWQYVYSQGCVGKVTAKHARTATNGALT